MLRFCLSALALAVLPLAAQAAEPRAIANTVAEAIEGNYFDENRAVEIADTVRRRAQSGALDGIENPLSLASALTAIIEPFDGHFRVTWASPAEAGDSEEEASENPAGRSLYGFGDQIRRAGYGFATVSILPGNIGYIEMTNFADIDFDDPADPAKRAADAALALIAASDAVIIDLRTNGGGSPAMVGYLVSAFTPAGAPIYNEFQYRGGSASEAPGVYYAAPRLETPLYIVTSARTGSAAEALPYTLQAADRAVVVGEATAGGANPGGTIDVGEGFTVFVSNGSPVNPITGGNWEGSGVVPDVEVPAEDALRHAQILALDALASRVDAAYRNDIAWSRAALEADESAENSADLAALAGSYGPYRIEAADDGLLLHQGRRPVKRLGRVSGDLFFERANPLIRYRFVREDGAVLALETHFASGDLRRQERE
ncbi:S41 family peptidase [Parasphingopyxis marina]|uniref:S41 family peptidase n=1 Tax=Parasphingopyxis marina TaxID=2761622 RepID=A0A842HYP9_9SPHN|nr:S41 family peptidase [Parasphingopyxis marina]MBC2777617.1 S41 family peptidase [Parasphingopyxis marina]